MPSTVTCFDEAPVDLGDGPLGIVTLDEVVAFDAVVRCTFAGDRAGRDRLEICFAGFDLVLLVAIWLSLV
jgi:hypothetical protein